MEGVCIKKFIPPTEHYFFAAQFINGFEGEFGEVARVARGVETINVRPTTVTSIPITEFIIVFWLA